VFRRRPAELRFDVQRSTERSRFGNEVCGSPLRPSLRRLLYVLTCQAAQAETESNAQISGIVKDPSGALLSGVEVTVTQTETGLTRTTSTNDAFPGNTNRGFVLF